MPRPLPLNRQNINISNIRLSELAADIEVDFTQNLSCCHRYGYTRVCGRTAPRWEISDFTCSILKEIGKGQRVALAKLAIDHLEKTNRPLRIAIDAAIWSFQNQASQGGLNPALRVFYFRLVRLLALPIHPLFVYDGPNKPRVKRNKKVGVWDSAETKLSKQLLQHFHFPYRTAPGEAEAECAALQKYGIVDAVMSQDADTVMFGSTFTIKNWSHEGQRGNHAPTHVDVLRTDEILDRAGLDTNGMILVALLSGGDYDTAGIPGFGAGIACEIAKVENPNFAADLLTIKSNGDDQKLREWREKLNHELQTNESKYFKRRHNISIPDNFPDDTILDYYTHPAVSSDAQLKAIEREVLQEWAKDIHMPQNMSLLREFTREYFEWKYKSGARKFIRGMTPSLLSQQLRLKKPMNGVIGVNSVLSRGERFEHDGIPEVRLQIVPTQIVPIDLNREEDNPANLPGNEEVDDAAEQFDGIEVTAESEMISSQVEVPPSPSKRKRSPPWNPDAFEKYWLPEILVKLGLPGVLEEWDAQQGELHNDPKKWASRKATKAKVKDAGMRPGAMTAFLKAAKPGFSIPAAKPPCIGEPTTTAIAAPRRQQQPLAKTTAKKTVPASPRKDRSIAHFFQPYAQTSVSADLKAARAMHTTSIVSSNFSTSTSCELLGSGSPTPRKGVSNMNSFTTTIGNDIGSAIELSSSPISSWVPPSTNPDLQRERDRSTSVPQGPADAAISLLSSPEALPAPSHVLAAPAEPETLNGTRSVPSSSPAFDTVPSMSSQQTSERGRNKTTKPLVQGAKRRSASPPSTIRATFKTTKPSTGFNKKISATVRESLPGAWKEIDLLDDFNSENDGLRKDQQERRRPRVSLVDLT